MDIIERFNALAFKRPVKLDPPPERSRPKPDEAESASLESWASERDTRITYVARLDRQIREGETAVRLTIGDDHALRYLLGRLDALRDERAWIMKTAGLVNGRPPQGE